MTDLKKDRTDLKRRTTLVMNSIEQSMAENDDNKIKAQLADLKEYFGRFQQVHDEYTGTLTVDTEIDDSDIYFADQQSKYIKCLNSVKVYFDSKIPKPEPTVAKDEESKPDSNISTKEMCALINLPKLELEPFDGDPMNYHSFLASFNENVDSVQCGDTVKLSRLLQFTTGKAKDAIRKCSLLGAKGYRVALEILGNRFGNDHLIAQTLINKITEGKYVRNADQLLQFADDVENTLHILKGIDQLYLVDNQSVIISMIGKLQPYCQLKWKQSALDFKRKYDAYPRFSDFASFVRERASDSNDPVYGKMSIRKSDQTVKSKTHAYTSDVDDKTNKINPHSTNVNQKSFPHSKSVWVPDCVLCPDKHRLWHCPLFKEMKPKDRIKVVKNHSLCENCLLSNHKVENCRKQSVCSVCGLKHTKFIHLDESNGGGSPAASNATSFTGLNTHMPIVQVIVNDRKPVYALLDTGSSASFLSQNLYDELGIHGKPASYTLSTLSENNADKVTRSCSLELKSLDKHECLNMSNVFVTNQIPVRSSEVNISQYDYLKDLNLIQSNVKVDVLIGQDNAEALLPLAVKQGKRGEPYAVRTIFGWCVNGASPFNGHVPRRAVITHFVSSNSKADIDESLNRLWAIENDVLHDDDAALSINDQKVIDLWDKECTIIDGHYQLPIPWKENVSVPNNISMAIPRLQSLKGSLMKRNMYDRYQQEIDKLLDKKYAELVPKSDILNDELKIWYLPHHAVVNDSKPGKVRVVYDCAAKFMGESLNDKCLQGPNLNNNLTHVLLRFRQHPVAIMADIEAMYNQVLIPPKDRDALRFIWHNEDGEIMHYRMTSHLFGGVWCASSSTYALRSVLKDFEHSDLVRDTVMRSFYVDDMLKSVENLDAGFNIMQQCPRLLQQGGFNLTKFVTNAPELLKCVSEDKVAKEVKDISDSLPRKALGVKWDTEYDQLYSKYSCHPDEGLVKRREMLSTVASMYDPLGLINPFTIQGKILFQDATRQQLTWDDYLPNELTTKWFRWLHGLQVVDHVRFHRCLKPPGFNESDAIFELHHFCDSSESAYGACSYLRATNKSGSIHTSLIMSKAKVAPIKKVTIPRLELQAAVLSTKLDVLLRNQIDLDLLTSYFWTDSELVLKYINNDNKRFQVFIANRVSAIQKVSNPEQWGHVPGSQNPADLITRGVSVRDLDQRLWQEGPEFLQTHKSDWRVKDVPSDLIANDPEVKKVVIASQADVREDLPLTKLIDYFSSWHKLKVSLCWILRVKNKLLRKTVAYGQITVPEMERAESIIFVHAQRNLRPQLNQRLAKHLKKLCPYVDDTGVIRVGGRLKHSSTNSKNQIIVPKGKVVTLLIDNVHMVGHLGLEYVLAQLRDRYWISRKCIREYLHRCVICRKIQGRPLQQKMANLPESRVTSHDPPFTHVGVDCFGPFYIKRGRSEVKRYGCIFTCFGSRAIHIEKLESLDTSSFLNCLFRFIARRGKPSSITSDNGGNFVSANKELKAAIDNWNQKQIHASLLQKNITWHFNPPYASHMGGVWERQIRSIRKVLNALLHQQPLVSDDDLHTLLCQVECILNNRPITKMSDDVNDLDVLKPSHILLLKGGPDAPPCVSGKHDMYSCRWKQVQYLADLFWRRWIKQYLPELQSRSKWTKEQSNVSIGDIVLLVDENTPRNLWPLGRILEVNRGRDNLVRSVKVKTRTSVLVRPISKLVLLEGQTYDVAGT